MNNKLLFLAIIMLLSLFVLCACGENNVIEDVNEENPEVSEEYGEEYEEDYGDETGELEREPVPQEIFDKLVFSLNGGSFKIGDKYDDVKGSLGEEIRPAQTFTPCGGDSRNPVTSHTYDGISLEVSHDGIIQRAVISGMEFPNTTATFAGIKIGDTPEVVRNTFNYTADVDTEYVINYTFDSLAVSFGLDFEGSGNIDYISMDDIGMTGF